MHMSDALVSPAVAVTAGIAATTLLAVAARKMKSQIAERDSALPLMGVTGAFIFAAQMVNFAIPGTGSSGHIVGGVLLAALLGPWAGFLTLASVIVIQCLVFADGGLMALGCNILNMGAMTALVAYPLVFRPIVRGRFTSGRIMLGSIAACIVGLELGALLVVAETKISGITALPWAEFTGFMLPIHLAIGLVEGIATGAVLLYVKRVRPDLLSAAAEAPRKGGRKLVLAFAAAAVVIGGGLAFLASTNPDGLEWSVGKVTGATGLAGSDAPLARDAAAVQQKTSLMPDYDNTLSGIIGSVLVLGLVWGVSRLIVKRRSVDESD